MIKLRSITAIVFFLALFVFVASGFAQDCRVANFTSNTVSPVVVGTQVIFEGAGTCGRARFEINGQPYAETAGSVQGIIWQTEVFGIGSYQICFAITGGGWESADRQCVLFTVQGAVSSVPAAQNPPSGGCVHIVSAGETLSIIGQRYNVTWWQIAQANSLANPDLIHSGLALRIPGCVEQSQESSAAAESAPAAQIETASSVESDAAPKTDTISSESLWNLVDGLNIEELSFQIQYPEGWVYEVQPGSISLAPDADSLAVELDGDLATIPSGATITLNALSLSSLNFDAHASIEQANEVLTASDSLTITDSFELAVMSRRARTLAASGPDGRHGFATFWIQDGFLMLASLNLPADQSVDIFAYSWGEFLAGFRPTTADILGQPVAVPDTPLQVAYPLDWAVVSSAETAFQVADSDLKTGLSIFSAPVSDFISEGESGLSVIAEGIADAIGFAKVITQEEYLLGNHPAQSLVGQTEDEIWLRVWFVPLGEEVILMMFSASSEDEINAFRPTWNAIINSITITTN